MTELSGPGDFTGPTALIDFDDAADGDVANTRYLAQGVEFRNTGAPVPIRNVILLVPPGVATSSPNDIGTQEGINGSEFSASWTLLFASPTFEVGTFFGNDQGLQPTMMMQLSVFDATDALIGFVTVDANGNEITDQFAGTQGAYGSHGVHYFVTSDTDNAEAPSTLNEIDSQQWQFAVPTAAPANVGASYGNVVVAPLQTVVVPVAP